jgi:hypothetical protein
MMFVPVSFAAVVNFDSPPPTKSVGQDLSISDWNRLVDVLNGLSYDSAGANYNWGFGTNADGTYTLKTGAGIYVANGGIVLDTAGIVTLHETTTPGSAVTDSAQLYPKLDNKLYYLDADNVEHEIATGGSISGTENTVAKFSATGITDSLITDDGTLITMGGNVSLSTFGLRDSNVTTAISLGDASNTTLDIGSSLVGAINAVHQNTLTNTTAINSLKGELDITQTGAGLAADGTLTAWSGTNYLDAAVSLKAGISALDTAIGDLSNGVQLTDNNATAGATCLEAEVGTLAYTDNGTMGEFIGCARTGATTFTWVRVSIYTQ